MPYCNPSGPETGGEQILTQILIKGLFVLALTIVVERFCGADPLKVVGVTVLLYFPAMYTVNGALFYLTREAAERKLDRGDLPGAEKLLRLALTFMTPFHSEDTRAVLETLVGCTLSARGRTAPAGYEFESALDAIEGTRQRATQMLGKDPIMLESVQTKVDQAFAGAEAVASLELADIMSRDGRRSQAAAHCHTAIRSLQEYRACLVRDMSVEEVQNRKSDREHRWALLLGLPASERLALIDRCLADAQEIADHVREV